MLIVLCMYLWVRCNMGLVVGNCFKEHKKSFATRCHIWSWSWLGGRVEEYSAADMDDIREDWSIYALPLLLSETIF
ncbi:hypothetical protein HanIR_Chr16g0836711 [Helianthus annuus]|nr:hypothetical protein HanIR_Chr16g0836711 [Helianthus annuus]